MTDPALPPYDADFAPAGDGEAGAPAELPDPAALDALLAVAEDGFSALDLEDRVVISLLFQERIRVEQVQAAWHRAREGGRASGPVRLWRVLAEDPDIDRDVVFEEAARVFAFKTATVNRFVALATLRRARDLFPKEEWGRMLELGVLPVAVAEEAAGDPKSVAKAPDRSARRWVFGTHDPTSVEVQRFLRALGLRYYDLLYLPESEVLALVAETGSARNEYLERVHDADAAVDLAVGPEDEAIRNEDLEAEINSSALINLFEASLVEAVRRGASDIHICPDEVGNISVNFRIDGELARWYVEEKAQPESFLAVVKDRTRGVDRFARDIGQDGYLQRTVDGVLIRFRVSILPIAHVNQQARYESIVSASSTTGRWSRASRTSASPSAGSPCSRRRSASRRGWWS